MIRDLSLEREERRAVLAAGWVLLAGVALVAGIGLVICADLRETPLFWRNKGGYPLWLRDAVQIGFYPLAVVTVALAAALATSFAVTARRKSRGGLVALQASLLAMVWVVAGAGMWVAWENNLRNLRHDRPLHSKITHLP